MPRKRKASAGRPKKERRKRRRQKAMQSRFVSGRESKFYLPTDEFSFVFRASGIAEEIVGAPHAAIDAQGKRIKAVAPRIMLGIGLDKTAQWMREADDIARYADIRRERRRRREDRRILKVFEAERRRSYTWLRQDMPDLEMRSILIGSGEGGSATEVSDGHVVCYRGDDARYNLAREYWDGTWSTDSAGLMSRENHVRLETIHEGFATRKEAEGFYRYNAAAGNLCDYIAADGETVDPNRVSFAFLRNRAKRLRAWRRSDRDLKKEYTVAPAVYRGVRGGIVEIHNGG